MSFTMTVPAAVPSLFHSSSPCRPSEAPKSVYLDTNHEVRIYPGWNTSTNTPTGPTRDVREDRVNSYYETLTMSATPALDGNNHPTGGEAISNVQTLSRQYMSAGGQIVRKDDYFNLNGLTYSVSAYIGTQNTNYYTANLGYDY